MEKDDNQAVRWHRKAAGKGNVYAMVALGVAYENGRGGQGREGGGPVVQEGR